MPARRASRRSRSSSCQATGVVRHHGLPSASRFSISPARTGPTMPYWPAEIKKLWFSCQSPAFGDTFRNLSIEYRYNHLDIRYGPIRRMLMAARVAIALLLALAALLLAMDGASLYVPGLLVAAAVAV